MIDRKKFFDFVRPMAGKLVQTQIDGFNIILNKWESSGLIDIRWLAYMLATCWHETSRTMQPIAEYGRGKGKQYGKPSDNGKIHYGRGYVQLTWDANYIKMGEILGYDLYNDPDLAMNPVIATEIMFEGMTSGSFTGKHLNDYFNQKVNDPLNARRIINGTDRAKLIAGYYDTFLKALN